MTFRISLKAHHMSLTWSIFHKAVLTCITTFNSTFVRPCIIHTVINFEINVKENNVCLYRPQSGYHGCKVLLVQPRKDQFQYSDIHCTWAKGKQWHAQWQTQGMIWNIPSKKGTVVRETVSHAPCSLWAFTQAKFTGKNYITNSGLSINFLV